MCLGVWENLIFCFRDLLTFRSNQILKIKSVFWRQGTGSQIPWAPFTIHLSKFFDRICLCSCLKTRIILFYIKNKKIRCIYFQINVSVKYNCLLKGWWKYRVFCRISKKTIVWFMSFGQSVECRNLCWMSNICYCYLS